MTATTPTIPPKRALVVDDNAAAREFARMSLQFEGYLVDEAPNPQEALALLRQGKEYDVVVLDVDLPGMSGVSLIKEIRSAIDCAIVMLSACDDSAFSVIALESGADDYCVKPVAERELTIRVEMAIQRHAAVVGRVGRPAPDDQVVIVHGALSIDPYCRITVVDGVEVELTAKEFDLLALLASAPGIVFTRAQLLEQVWDAKPEWQSLDTVTEHIYRLRQKLDPDGSRNWIQTLRGAGYRFERRQDAAADIQVAVGR